MYAYPLRDVDDDLWHQVKVRAMTEKVSVRDVLMTALHLYVAGRLAVQPAEDGRAAKARPTLVADGRTR